MLLTTFASYIKSSNSSLEFRAIRENPADLENNDLPAADPGFSKANIVEDGTLSIRPVGEADGSSGFTHFVDGIDKKRVIGEHAGLIPVVYGLAAAVIRERGEDRKLFTWRKPVVDEAIYLPFSTIEPESMRQFGLTVRDIKATRKGQSDEMEIHPLMLKKLAWDEINSQRASLERKLAEDWMRAHAVATDWLLVDGSITVSYEMFSHPNVVGVIKSHQTQYFSFEEQRRILGLKTGERSSVFEPIGRTRTPVYSWYLRLHPNDGYDSYFGLVRVEAAKSEKTLQMADEISRWLMIERKPLSLPDGRWDKLLYPIRDCEQYLKSIVPSQTMIEAALAGM